MAVQSAVYEVEAAVLSPTEQRDIFHLFRSSRDRRTLQSRSPFTMPVVVVDKADLWERLGRDYSNLVCGVRRRLNS